MAMESARANGWTGQIYEPETLLGYSLEELVSLMSVRDIPVPEAE